MSERTDQRLKNVATAGFFVLIGVLLGAGAVYLDEFLLSGPPQAAQDAERRAPLFQQAEFGVWKDHFLSVTLEDYVEFVFLTPDGAQAAREFGLIVEPLIIRAKKENPPDFIRVPPKRFGKVVQALPGDTVDARMLLCKILDRSPEIPPNIPLPKSEWDQKVIRPLELVPGELVFLRRLPTLVAPSGVYGPNGLEQRFEGHSVDGQGNAAAVRMALRFMLGERKPLRSLPHLPLPPDGP